MDDPKGTIGKATDLLRYLGALKRDARTAGSGSSAEALWEQEAVAKLPQLMRLLAEACGVEVPN